MKEVLILGLPHFAVGFFMGFCLIAAFAITLAILAALGR